MRKQLISWLGILSALFLGLMEASAEVYEIIIPAGEYEISELENGMRYVKVPDFGYISKPGHPSLPVKTFLIAIPFGAKVNHIEIHGMDPIQVQDNINIPPAPPNITYQTSEEEIQNATDEWLRNYEEIYYNDMPYPEAVGESLGQSQWRQYTLVKVQYYPLQYHALSKELQFFPECLVSIDYELPNRESDEFIDLQRWQGDFTMDDMISQHVLNYEDAQMWYNHNLRELGERDFKTSSTYVIIVKDNAAAQAVGGLKQWKEMLGYQVKVVTVTDILKQYTKGDRGERIWSFLKDKAPLATGWGIRYVLLAADIDVIPQRVLYDHYPTPRGYSTDYYYAKLTINNWDIDGDNLWGEFATKEFDPYHDVVVGRIPFNDATNLTAICKNIIDFEMDSGAWKNNVLLAHGFLYVVDKNNYLDFAELGESFKKNFFNTGWNVTTLYEKAGLCPSLYNCDKPLNQTNFLNECGWKTQSIINLDCHGSPGRMASVKWKFENKRGNVGNGKCDKNEIGYTDFSFINDIKNNPVSALVFLNGCSTGPLGTIDYKVSQQLLSFALNNKPQNSLAKEYLRTGAPAVIGSTAGSDNFSGYLNKYFYEELITKNKKTGDAFFDAQIRSYQNYGPRRELRVYNYLGDPSLNLMGINYATETVPVRPLPDPPLFWTNPLWKTISPELIPGNPMREIISDHFRDRNDITSCLEDD